MTSLKLPLILAAVAMLQGVEAACVEDNCYGAIYWNPAGAEECSSHFITTVIPPPTTTTLTITSGVADSITITSPFVGASTVIPSEVIPTYIVRACYGDVAYRFESACSCIGAGPTTTTAAQPVVTNTVIVPFTHGGGLSTVPPVPLPFPISVEPGRDPACVPIGLGPVIVTVQVEEVFAMTLTVSGPALCIGETTPPPPQSSGCDCASTLPSSAPFSSSFTGFAISNGTSSSPTESFSTVSRTTFSEGFFNRSTSATPEPSSSEPSTSEEPTSTRAPTSLETSESSESTTSSHTFLPFETRNISSTEASSTVEPSTSTESSQGPTRISTTAFSGPTNFIPRGREIYLLVTSGTYIGQYIETDEPDATVATNLKSHVTTDLDFAAVWTLDAMTGILFQEIEGAWWGAYFGLGVRAQWSSILLLPADTIVSWLTTPVTQKSPLKCVIDFTASNVLTCGSGTWTMLMQSDKCGWAVTTPFNAFHAAACPGSEELTLQAVEVNPLDEGISK